MPLTALVVGFVVAGCVVAPVGELAVVEPPSASAAVRRRLVRTVVVRSVAADAAPAAGGSRPVTPATPSPWERFTGALAGPSYAVAHARGPVMPVSAFLGGPAIAGLSNPTKVGAPRVVLVVAETDEWLQVLLPLRPNNSLGWVQRRDVDLSVVSLRVEIDRAAHRLRVFDGDVVVIDEPVAVGRPNTPTPAGQFFTTELLRPPNAGGAYGPYAFTLSAYSTVYQRFGSGDGAVGLHGTNEPRLLGSDASHGCIRIGNDAVSRLAALLPLGTPVVIR